MNTVTIKVNPRTKVGQNFIETARILARNYTSIEIVNDKAPTYDTDFVKKIQRAEKEPDVKIDLKKYGINI